jgi:hypothetical protein
VHTAIAGASFAAVVQLASRENLNQVLILSIFCFAVAIPASVAMVFISQLAIPEGMKFSETSQMEKKRLPLLSYLIWEKRDYLSPAPYPCIRYNGCELISHHFPNI